MQAVEVNRMRRIRLLTSLAAVLLVAAASAAAAPRSTLERPQVSVDVAHAVAVTNDGKTIVAGISRKGSRWVWAIVRYRADGSLDPTFGSGGRVLTKFGSGMASAVALQSDGKIVVGGGGDIGSTGRRTGFALARYTPRGRLDPTFGRNGRVLTGFGRIKGERFSLAQVVSLIVAPDGKIVASGWRGGVDSRTFALARYTKHGKLDPSFGSGGKLVSSAGTANQAQLRAAALEPNGEIVAVGSVLVDKHSDFAVLRFTARGRLDQSFGKNGRVLTAVGPWGDPAGVVTQAGGRIVVGGTTSFDASSRYALVRYLATGQVDPAFGNGGQVLTEVDPTDPCSPDRACATEFLHTLLADPAGRLVAAGTGHGPYFALARFTADGAIDPSFGSGGTTIASFPAAATSSAAAVRSDGSIVAVGSSSGDFAVVRFTSSGNLDPRFGGGGRRVTAFGPNWMTRVAAASAVRVGSTAVVRWRTASEFDARGFYLDREVRPGLKVPANRVMLPAKGNGAGTSYVYRDRGVPPSTRRYLIREVTVDGSLRRLRWVAVRR